MACEIGNSPCSGSPFEDVWTKNEGNTSELDAISNFNNNFDEQNSTTTTINPALTYSNPSTPQANMPSAYDFNGASGADLNQTLLPAPAYEAYPSPFNAAPASPYFQSVEVNHAATYHHSPLRNEQFGHRRSVSEPPGMPDQQPSMVFHRDEHWLGPTVRHKPTPLKSQHKHKSHRSHPYPTSARNAAKYQVHPHSLPQGVDRNGYRPHVQRAYTQPVRQHAPTSAPMMSPQHFVSISPQPLQQVHMHAQAAPPVSDSFHMQSTNRVCTPTPIDPLLSQPSTPSRSSKRPTTLNIPMTVDELREMIYEAVQTAVCGGGGGGGVGASKVEAGEKQQAGSRRHDDKHMTPQPAQLEEASAIDASLGFMEVP